MRRVIPLLLLVSVLAACQRESAEPTTTPEAEPASAAAPAAPAPTPGVAPVQAPAADPAMPPSPGLSLVGEFAGGDTRLSVRTDGGFVLTQGPERVEGSWSVEEDGRVLRLDPNTKAQSDRVFEAVSADELRPRGGQGAALKRQPAAE